MLRVFSPTGSNVIFTCCHISFESGFSGFSGLQRTSLFWVQWSFVEDYLVLFFSPMRNASAGCFEMKAPINNNLPNQTNDVIINPENPDSNQWLLFRNFHRRLGRCLFSGNVSCNNFELGFTGLGSLTVFVPACLQTAHLIP